MRLEEVKAHLLAVQTPLIGLDDKVLLPGNMKTLLMNRGIILECGDYLFHFVGCHLWAREPRSAQVLLV